MGEDRSRAQADDARWSAWMHLAQRGDREAYASLLGELSPVITAFLRSRFGPMPFVEDCAQECLLSIHRARGSYDSRRPFRPWLFAIVRRRAIDELRARKRRGDDAARVPELPEPSESRDPSRPIDGARLLETLPEAHREALVMTKYLGLSIAEAAREAGVSDMAMKSRVHRAVRQIRLALDGDELPSFPPTELGMSDRMSVDR